MRAQSWPNRTACLNLLENLQSMVRRGGDFRRSYRWTHDLPIMTYLASRWESQRIDSGDLLSYRLLERLAGRVWAQWPIYGILK